jgi:hypothetical protein
MIHFIPVKSQYAYQSAMHVENNTALKPIGAIDQDGNIVTLSHKDRDNVTELFTKYNIKPQNGEWVVICSQ